MKIDTEKAKKIVIKHGVAMSEELVVEMAFPALQEAVKESATPIDDVILAGLEEPLKLALAGLFAKLKAI